MKKMIVIAAMLIGSAAVACPDLTGTFVCPSMDQQGNPVDEIVTISQSTAGGVTTYTFADANGDAWGMPADGQLYSATYKNQESGNDVLFSTSMTCAGDVVDQFISQDEKDAAGTQVFYIEGNIKMSLDASKNLSKAVEYRFDGQTYNDAATCTRK